MKNEDIRWIQRLDSFDKALQQLEDAVHLSQKKTLSNLEQQGLIQAFEFTYELAWNLIKDYFENQGETVIHGSRDAIRLAFNRELIENGDIWMEMIKSRALTSHTYHEETANRIAEDVCGRYFPEYKTLKEKMHSLKDRE